MSVSRTESIGGVSVTYSAETIEELVALVRAFDSSSAGVDGWIPWNGGKQPVPNGTIINAIFSDGSGGWDMTADSYDWSDKELVKYRVVGSN